MSTIKPVVLNSNLMIPYFPKSDRNKRAVLEKECHPACLLLSKLINEQGEFFVYYMKNCKQGGKKI
jgi:hypothetical protein